MTHNNTKKFNKMVNSSNTRKISKDHRNPIQMKISHSNLF